MSDQTFATGGCLCGAITYTIHNPPLRMVQCCCKDCQRASGTGHMSLAFFKEEDVTVNGEPKCYSITADSGNTNSRCFCPECGSRVVSRNSGRPGMTAVTVGSADDTSWFKPMAAIYCDRRAEWDEISEGLPTFPGMPPQ